MLNKFKELSLEDLVEFRDHGDMTNAPAEVLAYALELEKVHGMHLSIKDYGS